MKKPFICFFDVDKTLYNGYTTGDFCLFLHDRGYGQGTVRSEDDKIGKDYYGGKIDFQQATNQVVKLQARTVATLSQNQVKQLGSEFINSHNHKLFSYTTPLIDLFHSQESEIYLVSAAAHPSVQAIADFLGGLKYIASELETVSSTQFTQQLI